MEATYHVEYAKSNRSKCKICSQFIPNSSLRIGTPQLSDKFDGEIYVWSHSNCFFQTNSISSKDISGISVLRWEDQQIIKNFLKQNSQLIFQEEQPYEEEEEEEEGETEDPSIFVEYARDGSSTCFGCFEMIMSKSLKMGKEIENIQSGHISTNWFHLKCFQFPEWIEKISQIKGYEFLSHEDKKAIQSLIPQISFKRKLNEIETEESSLKKRRLNEEEKKRIDLIWRIKDRLKSKYSTQELKEILKYNNQSDYGSVENILTRCADGELNGALPSCSICGGQLISIEDKVKCTGNISAWSKCVFVSDIQSINRNPWRYPSSKELQNLLENSKSGKPNDKLESSSILATNKKIKNPYIENILKDFTFCVLNSEEDKEILKNIITTNGGLCVDNITKKVTTVISTFDQVSKDPQPPSIKKAIQFNIPIVSEKYVEDATENGIIPPINRYLLWKEGKMLSPQPNLFELNKPKSSSLTNYISKPKRNMVDPSFQFAKDSHILEDAENHYHVTLNMTDLSVGHFGKNSFYILQIIENKAQTYWTLFTKWGRIGQQGTFKTEVFHSKALAIESFLRIFYEKTKNTWQNYISNQFEKKTNKFYPVEIDTEELLSKNEEEFLQSLEKKSKLDPKVESLVEFLFNENTILDTMKEMEIDIGKLPLGKISRKQIESGYEVLEEIESELKNSNPSLQKLIEASNKFYTLIPHDFGNERPPIIQDSRLLQKKYDLLGVLGDIEVVANMLKQKGDNFNLTLIEKNYQLLANDIDPLSPLSSEWKRIETYLNNTSEYQKLEILEIYSLNRHDESERFSQFNHLEYRKLLWHGSSVAVFASILQGGLKIMPHSGGRVGRGIYFADMISKSQSYCGLTNDGIGLMLLCEVILGNIYRIQNDDPSLTSPPTDFNSVLAEGAQMPNSVEDYKDYSLSISSFPVIIPQGTKIQTGTQSSFFHNEYLVYNEGQVQLKYLLKLKWV